MRTIRTSKVEFDSSKQVREDADSVIVPAILTRESILPFADGKGYRSAKELQDAAWTLEGAWVVAYGHISTVFVTNRADIRGRVENVKFDPKINGIVGDIRFLKANSDQAFLDSIKKGELKDLSVAYFSEDVFTSGKFGDQPYDFLQQNFMFGHVAAGVPEGRCPSPFCGMAVDSLIVQHGDPEVTENYVRIRVRDPNLFVDGSFRTIVLSADRGIHAIIGKLKSDPHGSTVIQNYMFELAKGWTMEKAQGWVNQHKNDSMDAEWTAEYVNNLPDSCFAYVEESEKDGEGKTVPRSKRHLPFKNADGSIDHDHLVNALARVKQSATMPEGGKSSAIEKLCAGVRSWNREHPDGKIESDVCGTAGGDTCLSHLRIQQIDEVAREVERSRELLRKSR
jgi:hypothetical protein